MTATAPKNRGAFGLPITSMFGSDGRSYPPPLHCLDNPDDIADAVLFLLSDVPSWKQDKPLRPQVVRCFDGPSCRSQRGSSHAFAPAILRGLPLNSHSLVGKSTARSPRPHNRVEHIYPR